MTAAKSLDWKEAAGVVAEALSTTDSTPGGGSAAGVAGAMGCALAQMAAGISAKSRKIDEARRAGLGESAAWFLEARARFETLTAEDAASFDAVMAVLARPKDDPSRLHDLDAALLAAGEVPLETAKTAAEALARARKDKPLTTGTVASDVNCAEHLLRAAGLCALENVDINAASMKDAALAAGLAKRAAEVRILLA